MTWCIIITFYIIIHYLHQIQNIYINIFTFHPITDIQTHTHIHTHKWIHAHTTLQCALHTLNTLQIAGSTPSSISPTPALRGRSQASEGSWLGKSGVHRHNLPNEDVCAGHTPPWPLGIKIAAWNWHRLQFELELLRYEWDNLSGAKWYTP